MSKRKLLYGAAWVAAAVIVTGAPVYARLFPETTRYATNLEHFKYGSVGVEPAAGVPYEIWRAMPGVCMSPEERAAGYAQFGFQWEPGRTTPIGMPRETALVSRVGVNCALCHIGRVEGPRGDRLTIGAPNNTLDIQGYLRFMQGCATSPAFTPDALLAENARQGGRLNVAQRAFYRFVIIPQMKGVLRQQQRELAFMATQPDWGPGRASGFQPAKVQILKQPYDGTVDIVDIPPLWNTRLRTGGLHWDGVNTSVHEVFLNSGIGNGATGATVNVANLERLERWMQDLKPAAYPWPVDRTLAAAGREVFAENCAACHDARGPKLNQVIPISALGTDRNRLDAFTPETRDAFKARREQPWRYEHFRKTGGYVAAPLDGIWARAPYLHNGSVPSLAALLQPPEARPIVFRRGGTAYDPVNVGFQTDRGVRFDTRLQGNGNGGHLWGVDLPEDQKRALIEFLKTS